MAEAEETVENEGDAAPKKGGKLGLLLGLALALLLGAGGFYAAYSGLLPIPAEADSPHAEEAPADLPDVAFVPLEPLVISLGQAANRRHLRFRAELEVVPGTESEVARLSPRVMDVLNSYLRAVSFADMEDPSALIVLRAQMLRRIQLITGEGRVRDLLIMEFVLS